MEPQGSWLRALRAAIPEDGILINELTQVGYVGTIAYPIRAPRTFLTPGYQGTLGYGWATALGAAVGNPDKAVVAIYEADARQQGAAGLGNRILGMRDRIRMGDTSGALALVDSARTQPLDAFAGTRWSLKGNSRYYAAHILALLGRKDEAVAMLRDALNNCWRLVPDEPLQWYWAPIKDYPSFVELVKLR